MYHRTPLSTTQDLKKFFKILFFFLLYFVTCLLLSLLLLAFSLLLLLLSNLLQLLSLLCHNLNHFYNLCFQLKIEFVIWFCSIVLCLFICICFIIPSHICYAILVKLPLKYQSYIFNMYI